MEPIDDIPSEPFPEKLCYKILTLNFSYLRMINNYNIEWDNLNQFKQFKFIKKLRKIYENEWIKNYIDTDLDDY